MQKYQVRNTDVKQTYCHKYKIVYVLLTNAENRELSINQLSCEIDPPDTGIFLGLID